MADLNRYTERRCPRCGSVKNKSQFQYSPNPRHKEEKMPYCRACCSAMLNEYIQQTNSEAAGLWCLLMELGIPFLSTVWENVKEAQEVAAERGGRKPDVFATYIKLLKEREISAEGIWQSDVMLDDFIDIEKPDAEEEEDKLDLKEQERIWGRFEPEDYEFLNDVFDAYTAELPNMDMALIMRYRDLCKAELAKRKADEEGDVNNVQKAQKTLGDTLKMLKLDNFGQTQKTDEQKAFEKRVAWIEYTKPAECEDLLKYLDMVGYEKEKGEKMRSLRNAVAGTRDYPNVPKEEQ